MSEKVINIGLLGLGTVGTGVYKILEKYPNINVKKIAVSNLSKKRELDVQGILTDDIMDVVNDPGIDILVELIGGIEPAFTAIKTAIESGKHVVSANKKLIAQRGQELFTLARANGVCVLFEAAVAGGIPIIMPMKQSLAGNEIKTIAGILNGTTNYILTKMESEKAEFEDVLAEAQKLGYAEADPTDDVDGFDACYKIGILASIAFDAKVDYNNIYAEGIRKISTVDIDFATELGYKVKLLGMAKSRDDGSIDARVHPTLVPKKHPLASINGVTNAIFVEGDAVGEVMFSGPGAGEMPTASSVLGDILAIAGEIPVAKNVLPTVRFDYQQDAVITPIGETTNSYYIRIHVTDKPGVVGSLGMACGNHGVSLASVIQHDTLEGGIASIVLLTQKVKEDDLQAALKEMENQETTRKIANVIRVLG